MKTVSFRRLCVAACGLALLALGCGCSKIGQIRECQSIAEVANEGLVAIEQLHKAAPRSAETFASMASAYEDLAKRLTALPVSNRHAQEERAALAGTLRRAGGASRSLGLALGRNDARGIEAAKQVLERTARDQKAIASRFDHACTRS
jgi:hypothetical protein